MRTTFDEKYGHNTGHAPERYRCNACPCMDPRNFAFGLLLPDVEVVEDVVGENAREPIPGGPYPPGHPVPTRPRVPDPQPVSNWNYVAPARRRNEQQLLFAGGVANSAATFTLSFRDETTPPLPFTASHAQIKSALVSLAAFEDDDIEIFGGELPVPFVNGSNLTPGIEFKGQWSRQNLELLTAQVQHHGPEISPLNGGPFAFVQSYRDGVADLVELRWDGERFSALPQQKGNRCAYATGLATSGDDPLDFIDATLVCDPRPGAVQGLTDELHPPDVPGFGVAINDVEDERYWWLITAEYRHRIENTSEGPIDVWDRALSHYRGPHAQMFSCRARANVFRHVRTDVLDGTILGGTISFLDLGFVRLVERIPIHSQTHRFLSPFGGLY